VAPACLPVARAAHRRYPLAMRSALALATLLLALDARAECTPAAPEAVAAAARQAVDAERRADELESVAVRSGNPGAARRAELARREAVESRRKAAALACQAPPEATTPPPRPGRGY
jgi:hypothetical protein